MWGLLSDVTQKTLGELGQRLRAVGPDLLAGLAILSTGLLAAAAARFLVGGLLSRLGFDGFARRLGLSLVLQKGGVTQPPSRVLAVGAGWAVLGLFVLLAIGSLNLPFATGLLARAFAYLPQLLIAVALLLLGSLIAGFLRRSVLIAGVNAGLPSARILAGGVHTALMILFVAMALEHLGVGRQVLLLSFAILFGGVVLALALSFGLAGRDLARELLEKVARRGVPGAEGDPLRHV